jgi:hypothetical protein
MQVNPAVGRACALIATTKGQIALGNLTNLPDVPCWFLSGRLLRIIALGPLGSSPFGQRGTVMEDYPFRALSRLVRHFSPASTACLP